ncbi:hypothetical protein M1555_01730 [Patescibacteria group bacterium]|nr:hypothetical protein [Patescibacteria group bacterium]
MKQFSIKEAISYGWTVLSGHWGFWVPLTVTLLSITYIPGFLVRRLIDHNAILIGVGVSLFFWIAQMIVTIGKLTITLTVLDGKTAKFSELLVNYRLVLKYFTGLFCYSILLVVGYLCLFVPGLYLSIRFQFWAFCLIDKHLGAKDSLRMSWGLTEGHVFKLIAFDIVAACIMLLGILALGVGVLVTLPVTLLATGYVYRKLQAAGT